MIGQERLRELFQDMISHYSFPRFMVLTGPVGSGKKTLCEEIFRMFSKQNKLNTRYIVPDIKVDSIRQMIESCYKSAKGTSVTVYFIHDADGMSTAAKNALLKVTEEPPTNAYIIMTLEDENNTLETVRSRASVFRMDNYTSQEIDEYLKRSQKPTEEEINIVRKICGVPGDVDCLYSSKPKEFYSYVEKAVDFIAEVEGANAFKLADKIALKQDSEGYDLKLFFRAFMAICIDKMKNSPLQYATGISVTSKYVRQLSIKGVSKQMLFDTWLLEIRKYWMR